MQEVVQLDPQRLPAGDKRKRASQILDDLFRRLNDSFAVTVKGEILQHKLLRSDQCNRN